MKTYYQQLPHIKIFSLSKLYCSISIIVACGLFAPDTRADCSASSSAGNNWSCSGNNTSPIVLSGGEDGLTVTTTPDFSLSIPNSYDYAMNLGTTGGDLVFQQIGEGDFSGGRRGTIYLRQVDVGDIIAHINGNIYSTSSSAWSGLSVYTRAGLTKNIDISINNISSVNTSIEKKYDNDGDFQL